MYKPEIACLPIFHDLDTAQLDLLDPLFLLCQFPKGLVIFEQGRPADHLYILISGEVVVRYKPYDGPPLVVARVFAGGVFGWSAALRRQMYTSAAVAETDARALRISGERLHVFCEMNPCLGMLLLDRLAGVISERLRNTHTEIMTILTRGIDQENDCFGRTNTMTDQAPSYSDEERLRALIEQLSDYINHYHGGSVELVKYEGETLTVHLGGACLGCPLSPTTLQGWVAGTVRQFFPEIKKIESI